MHTWLGSRWERGFDVVALVTAAATPVSLLADGDHEIGGGWPGYGLLAAGVMLVVLRRRAPALAAFGSVITSGLVLLTSAEALPVWVLAEICLFSLPLRGPRRIAIAIAGIHSALLYVGALVAFGVGPLDPLALILPVWTCAVVAFGTALRAQQDYVGAVEDRARAAAAAHESEVLRRVGDERRHIARDLHDSVANSLAVINLQASQAEHHVSDDPDRTRAALGTVRTVSRSTLTELATILAVLRDDEAEDGDRTVATAANIPHLVDLFRAAGLPVDADLAGLATLRFSPAVDAALYRVVQESVTNAQRHGDGRVRLVADANSGTAALEISNAVRHPRRASGSGFGLAGMRERVELAGGTLTVSDDDALFTVRAELPVAPTLLEAES